MKNIPVLSLDMFTPQIGDHHLYVNKLEDHLSLNSKTVNKPHKHNFFLTVIVTSGSGTHEIDFNKHAIKAGSIFTMRPGQTHHWQFSTEVKGYIFLHSKEFFDLYFNNNIILQFPFFISSNNIPAYYCKSSESKTFEKQFAQIYSEYENKQSFAFHKLICLIKCLYIDLSRVYAKSSNKNTSTSKHYMQTVQSLENLIEHSFKVEKSVEFYADKLNISSKHLNRIVKTTLDKTTNQLLIERLILEAKRMMINTKLSIKEIAVKLGYKDYAYFSRLFKLYNNCTPSQFKKKYLNQ